MLGNFGNMMEVIQKVQQNVASIQEGLRQERLESASGDVVRVVMNGAQEIVEIHLNPSYLSANNKAILEDLLTACLNDAARQSRQRSQAAMGQLTSDFNLPPIPGLF
ncbi:MAG: YbaB/EbfC family nucleoid-associated protein [Selenomonadales bacterium]|nr:YbaB/EbfC family nucleoid-associated protein [Selenomonadales bacterium]